MRSVLTIAGSDSSAGAGIQADLKTFAAHGVYGTSAVTAITAQNTREVTAVFPVPPHIVAAQIATVADDIRLDAVKTGMLASSAIIEAVADCLRTRQLPRVVIDPVMLSKSGAQLLHPDAVESLRTRLLPLAAVVTPNRPEAEALAGRSIQSADDIRDAARRIFDLGPRAVVIKGGHFEEPQVINVLFDGSNFFEYTTPRLETRHTHGTGCTFASSIAAHLARGASLTDAVDHATRYVACAIAAGPSIGHGWGPLDHFWTRSI